MVRATLITAMCAIAVGESTARSESVPLDSPSWEISAVESGMTTFLGRDCLRLKGGTASVKDAAFLDGIVEFDIAFTGERGFMGAVWRMVDESNYENFYLRPHQSGKPDASQYTPVFNGVSGWQLYHGDGYGAAISYDPGRWHRVKIVVSGQRAEVYIDDMSHPALSIPELKRGAEAGRVGLMAGNFAPAYVASFSYSTDAPGPLSGLFPELPVAQAGTVMSWLVSDPFGEDTLEGTGDLETPADALRWTALACEASGIANLASVCRGSAERNTTFARVVVESQRAQRKLLEFGYSDRARVYLNGRLLYTGDNTYQSRDFRYLGTIGLFDRVPLDLQKGRNELWIAVSESFGGWGAVAHFPDTGGITLRTGD